MKLRCTFCGAELIRYHDHYGTRYQCIVCGAHLDERTCSIVGGRLHHGARARAR